MIQDNVFASLYNLRELSLSLNNITTIQDNAFASLYNLRELYLNNNRITTIPDNVFASLYNLRELYLYGNEITTIQDNVFASLYNLRELYLGDNKITTIQDNAFASLYNLRKLYLPNNNITVLDKDIFLGLSKLETQIVEGNPLHCGCILADFLRFAKLRNLTLEQRSEPTCSTPSILTGVLLRNLSSEDMDCDVTTAKTQFLEITGKMIIFLRKKLSLICLPFLIDNISYNRHLFLESTEVERSAPPLSLQLIEDPVNESFASEETDSEKDEFEEADSSRRPSLMKFWRVTLGSIVTGNSLFLSVSCSLWNSLQIVPLCTTNLWGDQRTERILHLHHARLQILSLPAVFE
ncbi:leucine-rich repeat-containing protein 15-like [Saccostrea cucullata]|uniref:leucine-rich repeat-containing protein 15-like n=1 Tax=Saccostrea cuccullata TaxID=36930 RepID=UPI002ED35EF1